MPRRLYTFDGVSPSAPVVATLVDDFHVVLPGVRALLEPYRSRVVLVELGDALVEPRSVDVILYEPVRLSQSSHSMLRSLAASSGARPVVYTWREHSAQGAPAGPVVGRLSKSLTGAQLVAGIEAVHRHVGPPPGPRPTVDRAAHAAVVARGGAADNGLTPREAQILALITQGYTNVEIGKRLYLSINSVKTYVRGAYRKIDVERRTQAVAWGLQHGLGDAEMVRQPTGTRAS